MTTPSDQLWQDLRAAQDELLRDSHQVGQLRERMPLRAPARTRRKTWAWMLAASVTVGIVALGGAAVWRGGPKPLTFVVGESGQEPGQVGAWIAAPPRERCPLRFSDGSELALEAGSRARVVELDAAGAHVVLERGRALARVVHRSTSRWRVGVGPFEVSVVGTRFELDWNPETDVLRLALAEGRVVVTGAFLREPMHVTEGQTLVASSNDKRAELMEPGTTRAPATAPEPEQAPTSGRTGPIREREIAGACPDGPYLLAPAGARKLAEARHQRQVRRRAGRGRAPGFRCGMRACLGARPAPFG